MKIEYLINKIEELINASSTNFEFRVYDSLKMDKEKMDINKINGIARVVGGGFEPIASLGQGSVTLSVEFIYPYERLEAVNETLQMVAQGSAGLVVANSSFNEELQGTTGIAITYPIQGNYYNGTMGETAKSRLVCYFDINEKAVLANNVKIEIQNGYQENNKTLVGKFFVLEDGVYKEVELPKDYKANTQYYTFATNRDGLPSEYRELTYIVMNTPKNVRDPQYIDLGIKANQDTSIELEFDVNSVSNTQFILGAFDFNFRMYNAELGYAYGSNGNNFYSQDLQIGQHIIFKLGKKTYFNGSLIKTFGDETFETSYNIALGTWINQGGGGNGNSAQMNVYRCNIYDNDVLIKQLIPCYRVEDNRVGMYDLINNEFFENYGDTEFGKGDDLYQYYNSTLVGKYYVLENGKYKQVSLPTQYTSNTIYYTYDFEKVPFYKYVITRHRLSTTNKYENNPEMQTVNDGQSIDFSLAVPSIKGSVINQIKDDMLLGLNTQKGYAFRFTDESGPKVFEDMIASGDFSYDVVPGDTVIFKILFVYKR
jgi:hypothetical protein